MLQKVLAVVVLGFLTSGCVGTGTLPELPAASVELKATPFHPQERYQCGPAALATVLQTAAVDVSPEALVDQVWLPERRGSLQLELVAATRQHDRLPYVLAPEFAALLAELQAGRPVLVLQNLGTGWYPVWHFAVVVGFESGPDRMLLRSGTQERLALSLRRFLRSWELAENWAMVVLEAGELPAQPDRRRYLTAVGDLERTGRQTLAIDGYQAWLQHHPGDTLAWFGLANSHYALGDAAAAEQAYQQLLAAQPGHPAASNNLARLLLERGCVQAAQRWLDAVSEPLPERLEEAVAATRREVEAAIETGSDEAACLDL